MPQGSDKLRIAIVTSPIVAGGTATHLGEIIPRLRKRGHRVLLVTTGSKNTLPADSVRAYRSLPSPVPQYGFIPSAMTSINGLVRGCDIVHIHGYTHCLADLLTLAHPCNRKPIVLTLHGSFHQFPSRNIRIMKSLHNMVMLRFARFIGGFIAVSHAEKAEVVRRGLAESKIDVIYNGISDLYRQTKQSRDANSKRVLFLGRLTSSKNPDILVRAMGELKRRNGHCQLVIAGPDWGEGHKLRDLAAELEIGDRVQLAGEIAEADKADFFASCDVFVHPSLQDIFSISVLEASSAGLPVVAFNTGGNSEMIVHGKTGVLVDNFTPEALCDGIMTCLSSREVASRMGKAAREHVLGKFSWDEAAEKTERVYRKVIEAAGSK